MSVNFSKNKSYPKEPLGFLKFITFSFRNNPWIPISAILIISILLRLPHLGQSLWFDELWTTKIKLGNVDQLIRIIGGDVHPPFFTVFAFFWVRLFGDSEISIRLPSLIFGIFSILLVYAITLKYADRKTALLSSFILALSPVHIWYSQEARFYSAALFFSLLSIFSYLKIEKTRTNPIWYSVYFCSLFATVFCHYYMLVYLIGISVICLLGYRNNKQQRKILIFNVIILGLFCLFVLLKIMFGRLATGMGYLRPFTFFELWMLFLNWFSFGNSIWTIGPYNATLKTILKNPIICYAQIFFLFLFVHGLIINFRKSQNHYGKYITFLLFSIPALLLGLTFIGFKHTYIERSAFVILPFFYMTLARGTTGFKNKSVARACMGVVIVFSIIALVGFLKKPDLWTVYKQKPDWRTTAHYFNIETNGGREQLFIFQVSPSDELYYYFKKEGINPTQIVLNYFTKEDIYDKVSAGNIRLFYLIKNKYWNGGYFDTNLTAIMKDRRFSFLDKQSFKGLVIFKFKVATKES